MNDFSYKRFQQKIKNGFLILSTLFMYGGFTERGIFDPINKINCTIDSIYTFS
ncbi:MAG: hypothetical protein ACTSRH_09395 [Promethearchaeota archaeon]